VKQPGLGGSVAWHQDGLTHWGSKNWDQNIHGFNFQAQLHTCTLGNCLWVLPGSHKLGKLDLRAMVAANGNSELLPGAVPLFCNAGDVTLVNRQAAHCSFANTSEDLRVSLTFGFHKKSSVLGATGVLGAKHADLYDEARIFERSRIIAVAIDARAQHYPNETPFTYEPFVGEEDSYRFTAANWREIVRNYNLKDLGI
jgi:ectoine hydroxylase-related dioxygenase (phytanoyl-CoA dioxygenase family)